MTDRGWIWDEVAGIGEPVLDSGRSTEDDGRRQKDPDRFLRPGKERAQRQEGGVCGGEKLHQDQHLGIRFRRQNRAGVQKRFQVTSIRTQY